MRHSFKTLRRQFIIAAALMGAAAGAFAQSDAWPSKPVRIIALGSAGGTSDLIARILAEHLGKTTNKTFIVDAKPGGAGIPAATDLLRAPHDGHTLMVAANLIVSEVPHSIKMPFDPFKDLVPVAELTRGGYVLVGSKGLPANNFNELLTWMAAQPQGVSYASFSPGTMSHILGLQLAAIKSMSLTHVGYRGSTLALQDVMAGHVPLMFDALPTSIPLVKGGKLKAFAVSSDTRSSALPDVPTLAEMGLPQMTSVGWMGLWLPSGVPEGVQKQIRNEILKALALKDIRERLVNLGQEVGEPLTIDQMRKALVKDSEKNGKILKSVNYQP